MAKKVTTKKAVSKSQARRKAVQEEAQPIEATPKELPEFHGKKVVEVLEEGHIEGFKHCRMEDNSTQHVPNELF